MRGDRGPACALVLALVVTGGAARAQDEEAPGARSERLARSDAKPPLLRMSPPGLDGWEPVYRATSSSAHLQKLADELERGRVVVARGFNAPVFGSRKAARVVGRVRRGNALAVVGRGPKCGRGAGRWYEVEGGGFVCTARDFRVSTLPLAPNDERQPDVNAALPFRYGRVVEEAAPRWSRVPTPAEEREGDGPALVERMEGDYFLALAAEVHDGERTFWRTVEGEYVRKDFVQVRDTPTFLGEHVEDGLARPLAFVFGEEPAPLACRRGDGLEPCGEAQKHARFVVVGRVRHEGEEWLYGADGLAVPRARLRLVERARRPSRVDDDEKWVHVNLSEQTLVAYEGDEPVYATLISSGKPGFTTPTGLYRTKRKYLSKTMRGSPRDGTYHVEEVPWTLYYHRGWAVHGAYWHNTFGAVRSHGCTNLAPADARWLYHWATLEVPDGWHAVVGRRGTWFWFTRERS